VKEISKLSELMKEFLSDIEKKIDRENKDIKVYDVWDEIIRKESMKGDISLEDIRNSSLMVYVKHPGMAQQIRLKSRKILSEFNARFPNLKVSKINIMLKNEMSEIANNNSKDKD